MKKTKVMSAKRSFFMSVLSLILCFAMLIGTTWAWFTDSVTSGKNQIVAGNLDVELYHRSTGVPTKDVSEKVTGATNLFHVDLWEPGVIAYENFTVANVGNLAFKYDLKLDGWDYNTVTVDEEAHDLREVIKVATVAPGTFNFSGTPAEQRAQAQTLFAEDNDYSFKAYQQTGVLYPVGNTENLASDSSFCVVLYWEPTDNDNIWNINNGKHVSDGYMINGEEALWLDIGINLVATQVEHEFDSFDNRYDAGTDIALPETVIVSKTAVEGTATVFTTKNTPANDKEKKTTVTFEADALEAGASYQLTAKTYNALASTANFIVTAQGPSDNAVAAIDLTLMKQTDSGEVQVSEFEENKTVTVDTYITKNLQNAVVAYGDTVFTEVTSAADVDQAREYFYDKATGHLVFCTNHFSEYLVGSTSVAYIKETDTAYDTFKDVIAASADGNTVILLKDAANTATLDTIAYKLTLDLNSHKLTNKSINTAINCDLTVKNGTYDATSAISPANGSKMKFENVKFVRSTTSSGAQVFQLYGKTNVAIDFNNCEITSTFTTPTSNVNNNAFLGFTGGTCSNLAVNFRNSTIDWNDAVAFAAFSKTDNPGYVIFDEYSFAHLSHPNPIVPNGSYTISNGYVIKQSVESGIYTFTLVKGTYWTDQVTSKPVGYVENGNSISIGSEEAFAWFAKQNDSFAGKTVTLTADLDMGQHFWKAIATKFEGTFDGGNHTISNVSIPDMENATQNVEYGNGLFRSVSGTVKNLTVKNTMVGASCVTNIAGVVAGYSKNGTFENITIQDCSVCGFGKVGGLIGMADEGGSTKVSDITIKNLTVKGNYNMAYVVGFVYDAIDMSNVAVTNSQYSYEYSLTHKYIDVPETTCTNDGCTRSFSGKYWADSADSTELHAAFAKMYNLHSAHSVINNTPCKISIGGTEYSIYGAAQIVDTLN